MGASGFLGGVTDNRQLEAFDVIELLTNLKKFCPLENRHEMGRGNRDGSGAVPRSILLSALAGHRRIKQQAFSIRWSAEVSRGKAATVSLFVEMDVLGSIF